MLDAHLSYLAVAYGLTALALAIECVVLLRTRRQSIEQVRRERDLDLDDHESIADLRNEAATP
jgi:heme exporter protein D